MKANVTILAVCLLAVVVFFQVPLRDAGPGSQPTPGAVIKSPAEGEEASERRPPAGPETRAAAVSTEAKAAPTSLAAMPPTEQRSLEDQMRAAQNWFACAGNTSNGSPRLVAWVRGQKFAFIAEESGVRVRPWTGATNWSWQMAAADGSSVAPKAEKERATYARGAGVTEWFENGERGVEQGFTLDTANGESVRRMELRVTTELQPKLRPQADGVDFIDAKGDAQLHYDGLQAFDAEGNKLKSWIEVTSIPSLGSQSFSSSVEPHLLTLAVDTTGARFPVTVDPVISLASERISHPEPVPGDLFGVTVAACGNLIAIGAPRHAVTANNGVQEANAGVVYLFVRDDNCAEGWTFLQKIASPNPYDPGHFGRALSLGSGVLAVAAHRLTLFGGGADVMEDVVHIFQPSPTDSSVWTRRATLKDTDPNTTFNPTNYFGYSISVNSQGTRVAIGSPLASSEGGQFPIKTGKVFLHGRDTGGADN